ncbi:MAG: DUF58 domain-containing protein [Elainellaceae cyanobacterium]
MVPTPRFYALLILTGAIATGLAIFAPAAPLQIAGMPLQAMLVLDLVLVALAVADGFRAKQQRVSVARGPLERLSVGRDNPVTLTVQPSAQSSAKSGPKTIQIYDAYPAGMAGTAMPLQAAIASGEPQTLTYSVHPRRRGEVAWGKIHLRQRGPWGLAWHQWQVPQAQTVAVYPDLMGLRALAVRLALQASGSLQQRRRMSAGTEFSELRDYAAGDDPRLIDWKATARTGQPLVKVMEPEQEQTLIVLLDRGRLMTAQVEGLSRFDWGLNATLSLALAGIRRGDRVGVGVFDSQVQTWLPPNRGQPHFSRLIERLTPIQPVLQESDYLSAVSMLVTQQHRRALVVLITDIVDATASAELLSALARLRPRYLPLCVALSDPYIQQRADQSNPASNPSAQNADIIQAAYARAAALDLMDQRQVAFVKLRQKGVMVLDAPVDAVSEQLVDRYLQIKARNQL